MISRSSYDVGLTAPFEMNTVNGELQLSLCRKCSQKDPGVLSMAAVFLLALDHPYVLQIL